MYFITVDIVAVFGCALGSFLAGYRLGRQDARGGAAVKQETPRCTHCGRRLRPVTLVDLTWVVPKGACWVCPGTMGQACDRKTTYFGYRAVKPTPEGEV